MLPRAQQRWADFTFLTAPLVPKYFLLCRARRVFAGEWLAGVFVFGGEAV